MDLKTEALNEVEVTRHFFARTTECLEDADSAFQPAPGMMTVAGQVAHAAHAIDWFREGAFTGNWDMDWEAQAVETAKITSLTTARRWLEDAWGRLREAVTTATPDQLAATLPDNPILPGRPLYHVVESIVDHTGHHRGALAVYARLLGKVPKMPYGED